MLYTICTWYFVHVKGCLSNPPCSSSLTGSGSSDIFSLPTVIPTAGAAAIVEQNKFKHILRTYTGRVLLCSVAAADSYEYEQPTVICLEGGRRLYIRSCPLGISVPISKLKFKGGAFKTT